MQDASGTKRNLPHPLRRWFRWTASGAITLVVYLVLLFAVENWRAERAWQSFRRDLNARGHLLEPAEPNDPRLGDEQNFLQAPLISSWFNPDQLSSGVETSRLIQLTRPGDNELIGSWSEVKPADLQEWRRFFHRPVWSACVSPAVIDLPPGQESDEVVPLVMIDDVPLRDAIRNMARQSGLEIRFDPLTFGTGEEPKPLWQPNVSIRFENVTARNALDAVLDNYGLRLLADPQSGVLMVTRALAAPSGWPHEIVDLENDPLPPGADDLLPSLTMDCISGEDAIRNAARQVGINFQFDVGIPAGLAPTNYSLTLSNVTPRRVLARVLADHGLALKASSLAPIYRVTRNRGTTRRQQDNTAAGVLESLAEFDEEFQALYAASERPGCQPDKAVRRQFMNWKTAPNYRGFSSVSSALGLHASAHLSLGHANIALRDATALARMIEALRNRIDSVGAMVRVGMSAQYLQVVWEGLAARRWNEEQLRTLERQMESVDLLSTCERALVGTQLSLSDWMEQTPRIQLAREFSAFFSGSSVPGKPSLAEVPVRLFVFASPQGWIRQNQLHAVRRFEAHFTLLDAAHQRVHPEAAAEFFATASVSQWTLNPHDYLARVVGPIYSRAVEHTARNQNGLNMARVACALERYRLRHGCFPEALAALTPHFMESLPNDVTTGMPLSYRTAADGQFVLHSAGWNRPGHDRVNPISGDWIWRYPAR